MYQEMTGIQYNVNNKKNENTTTTTTTMITTNKLTTMMMITIILTMTMVTRYFLSLFCKSLNLVLGNKGNKFKNLSNTLNAISIAMTTRTHIT